MAFGSGQVGKSAGEIGAKKKTREKAQSALNSGALAIEELMATAFEYPSEKVPNFRPHVVSFVGYLIAH